MLGPKTSRLRAPACNSRARPLVWHATTLRSRLSRRLPQIPQTRSFIVVHRAEYSVCYRRVEPEAFRLLQALQSGKPLGEALDLAFRDSSLPEDQMPALVQEWFGLWMSLGWFAA